MNNNVLFSLGRQQATTDAFERHVNKFVHKRQQDKSLTTNIKQSFSSGCLLANRDWKYDALEAAPNKTVGFLQLQNKNIKPLIYVFSLSS